MKFGGLLSLISSTGLTVTANISKVTKLRISKGGIIDTLFFPNDISGNISAKYQADDFRVL